MRFVYPGIFLLAASILTLQIAFTRVFAVMMWHHMTYMVVSITLLGFGAAGSLLTIRQVGMSRGRLGRALAVSASAYGLSVIAAFCIATRIPIDTLELRSDGWNFVALGLIYGVVSIPFLFGGFAICLALSRLTAHVNRLYFFDLLGSAAGAVVCIVLLSRVGSTGTVVIAGAIGVAAGSLFALAEGRGTFLATLPALALTVLAAVSFSGGGAGGLVPAIDWYVPFAPGKEFARGTRETEIVRLPSATAEVNVGPSMPLPPGIGGDFGLSKHFVVSGRYVGQDGSAPTMLYENGANVDAFPFLGESQAGSAYVAYEAAGGVSPRVLVIGVGGGVDVMVALAHRARRVTAVEVNRAMVAMVTEHFSDYLGGLFESEDGRVELVHAEGRSFIRSRDERYDIIQLSGVDSFTALSSGAYTVSESYLYTTEAIRDLYAHLEDGGYINYSRRILTYPRKPRESLRLANVARRALAELGVEDPTLQILVFRGRGWASTIIKRGPFSAAEVDALERFGSEQGFWSLVFDPLERPHTRPHPGVPHDVQARRALRRAATSAARSSDRAAEAWEEGLVLAYERGIAEDAEGMQTQLRGLLSGVPESRATLLANLVRARVERGLAAERAFQKTRADFDELLRGDEPSRRAFALGHPYDLSPATDDAPFFFNYYRYRFAEGAGAGIVDLYGPDYPVGHLVLVASLLQITLLATALILLPLRALARRGVQTPGRARVFAYFAALGSGFMFVEIVMMQRTVLFLGHPTYAISVVLAALLGFAGLGSLAASRVQLVSRGVLVRLGLIVVALVTLNALAGAALFDAAIGWSFAARVALVVAVLAPLGMALGMPFPLGIRLLDADCPQLVPWAWAINAFLSVFSSLFCIVLAMALGFSVVLLVAALIYGVGFLMLAGRASPRGAVAS